MGMMANTNTKVEIEKAMELVDVASSVHLLSNWRNLTTFKMLSLTEIKELTKAAQLLQVLCELRTVQKSLGKKQMLSKIGAENINELYNSTYEIINEQKLQLPASRRLEKKITEFEEKGAIILLSKKREMKNNKKIEGKNKAFLNYLLSHPNRLDATQIAKMYNDTVSELGKGSKISASAVKKIRSSGTELLTHLSGSQGKAGIKDLTMHRKRFRPTSALSFVSLDGWDVELAYKDIIKHKSDTKAGFTERAVYGLRHNVVVVSDACIDFPLGWFISTHETSMLIKAAMRSAMRFLKKKTGKFFYIKELKTDNFGSKDLKESYQRVSESYKPASVGNANDKPIEAWFKILNKKCQLHWNWTGYGNQAVTRHNTDLTNQTMFKKMQPSKGENLLQIEQILTEVQSEKFASWQALFDETQLKEMSHEDYLLGLGEYKKNPSGENETYKLSHLGIKIVRNNKVYFYQTFDTEFKKNALTKWNIIEDTEDLNTVLAINKEGTLRFLLHNQELSPMSLNDRNSEHSDYDSKIEQHNKSMLKEIILGHDENYKAALEIFEELQKRGQSNAQILKLMPTVNGQQKTYLKLAQTQEAIDKSLKINYKQDDDSAAMDALNDF